jgi:DNA-binding IclR family transcriptional regulator
MGKSIDKPEDNVDAVVKNTTFVNGLSLLEALARSRQACGVSELARQLQLTKSNVHRLLGTLVDLGYVTNVGVTGRYEVTLKLWELGVEALDKLDVKRVAVEVMEGLAATTGETAHLSVLDQGEVVYIDKVEGSQPVRAHSQTGGRAPAYCVATGKVMLAHANPRIVDMVTRKLRAYTERTITDRDQLHTELKRAVENGYAINRGEWREGVCGVAAPIKDARGVVIAAIGISGPAERLRPKAAKQLVSAVVEAAHTISVRLGWTV